MENSFQECVYATVHISEMVLPKSMLKLMCNKMFYDYIQKAVLHFRSRSVIYNSVMSDRDGNGLAKYEQSLNVLSHNFGSQSPCNWF